MIKHTKHFAVVLAATGMILSSSCKKEDIVTKEKSTVDMVQVSKTAHQLFSMVMPIGTTSGSFKTNEFECGEISIDSSSGSYVKTYDYGTGCTDDAGVVRRGIITATYNKESIQTPGAMVTLAFTNFFLNNDEVKGTMSIENTGSDSNGDLVVHFSAECQSVSQVHGEIQMLADQYFKWVEGGNTADVEDDVFSITGHFIAIAQNGEESTLAIQQPLVAKTASDCNRHFVEGVTLTQTTGKPDKHLDYGNGACDNLAVETVNGESYTIVLE